MKAVIFDMDGVLLDSEQIFVDSLTQFLMDQGVQSGLRQKCLAELTGMKMDAISRIVKENFGLELTPENISREIDRYFDMEVDRRGKLVAFNGLTAFLSRIKEQDLAIALATSSDFGWVDRVLTDLNVQSCFDTIVTGDQVTISKPEPDIFLLAAERLGVPAEDCVVIEDSVNGIKAAKRAGMCVVAFKGSEIVQDTSEADAEVDSYAALVFSQMIAETIAFRLTGE